MSNTFGTQVNPAHYVEVPDGANPGQVKRPDAGATLLVKDAVTLVDLEPITTEQYGYWTYSTDDTVTRILVSGDGGVTWVGPLVSGEFEARDSYTKDEADARFQTGTAGSGFSELGASLAIAADAAAARDLTGALSKTDDDTAVGVITFVEPPVVPEPTADENPATKGYVDDALDNAAPVGTFRVWVSSGTDADLAAALVGWPAGTIAAVPKAS